MLPTASDSERPPSGWRTQDVWGIAFSAFFADLGYQAILAIFPLYLVLTLGAPIWVFGLSQALAYGPGALFGYFGGKLGDRYGRWTVAVAGNAFIPLMALVGLSSTPAVAVALLVVGWWARNLRSPPRRALLVDAVPAQHRGEAFGLLHALDVGGGMLAAVYAFLLLLGGVAPSTVLLWTIVPLVVSTAVLGFVRVGRTPPDRQAAARGPVLLREVPGSAPGRERWIFWGIMGATVLYGFASFSIGFPVLTTARATRSAALGILVFVVALGVSSAVGLVAGSVRRRRVLSLALGGYLAAALGSGLFAVAVGLGAGLLGFLAASAVLGGALGAVETFEPTLISAISPDTHASRNLGVLSAFRSLGLFASNLVLGLLFLANGWLPYVYAAIAAVVAAGLLVAVARSSGSLGDVR